MEGGASWTKFYDDCHGEIPVQKLLSRRLIWDLIYQENDVDRKLMVFNQGNILIKENKNIGQ